MTKIIIADVLYTTTDETFYVLNRIHENATKYVTVKQTVTYHKDSNSETMNPKIS